MKTKYLIYMLLTMSFSLSSCREISIKTKVNNDGSFTRIITLRGDSSEVVKLGLPYPVDSTWKREIQRDTSDSSVFICTHTKAYNDDDELNKDIINDTSWRKQIRRDVKISKRFMFFYSFISYRQVYKAANPVQLDYHEYLNNEDLQWISGEKIPQNKQDSILKDSAENKVEKYLVDAVVEEIIHAMNKGFKQTGDPQLNDIDLSLYKDSIASKALEWSSPGKLENIIDALIIWSGNEDIAKLKSIYPPVFENLYNKIAFFDNLLMMENYTIAVEMPGLITETNSYMLLGNTASWNIENLTFFFEDYEIYVESRIVNYWAFVVSGLVLLLLLITLVIKVFK
ncbi:MAG: hypothetical protein HQ565_02520 [Bacteroidetes bacterium]|nr:hypothetical protein [Bacteroidota bacterium]